MPAQRRGPAPEPREGESEPPGHARPSPDILLGSTLKLCMGIRTTLVGVERWFVPGFRVLPCTEETEKALVLRDQKNPCGF